MTTPVQPAEVERPIEQLSVMLDAEIARDGPVSSFMIRSGLLRDLLDELARHRLASTEGREGQGAEIGQRRYLITEWDHAVTAGQDRAALFEIGNGLRNAVNDLLRLSSEIESKLNDLIALLLGDGGHRRAEVGLDQAFEEAVARYRTLRASDGAGEPVAGDGE